MKEQLSYTQTTTPWSQSPVHSQDKNFCTLLWHSQVMKKMIAGHLGTFLAPLLCHNAKKYSACCTH
jgi:hypothetical protein